MVKSLYEEALADAKKLREVAEANATNALIEAVKPRIKNLLETELMGLDDFGGAEGPGIDAFDMEIETSDNEEVDNTVPSIATNPAHQPPRSTRKAETPVAPVPAEVDDTMSSQEAPVNVAPVAGANTETAVEPAADGDVVLDLDALEVDPGKEEKDQMYELSLETIDKLSSVKKAGSSKDLVSDKQMLQRISLMRETISQLSALPAHKQQSRREQRKIAQLIETTENMYGYVQELLSGSPLKQKLEMKLEEQFKDLNGLKEKKESDMKKKLVNEEDLTLKLTGLPGMEDEDLENIGVDLVTGDGDEEELDVSGHGDEDHGDHDMDSDGDDDLDFDFGGDDDGMRGDDDQDMDENQVIEIDESAIRQEIKRMRQIKEETKPASWGHGPGKDSEDDFGGGKADHEPFEDGKVTTESDMSAEADEDVHEGDLSQLQNRRKGDEKGRKVADQHDSMAEQKRRATQNGKLRLEQAEAQNEKLRAQLTASNLFNAKLVYTNKLLQLETLTKRQKATIVERLEETKTLREVKLIYESLMSALKNKKLQENAEPKVRGSSSSILTSSGAPSVISESVETQRWAQLAGLTRRNRK